ncbi:MAG: hypothetical protein ACTSPP_05030 [Candidatus Heimdallarchaeaceae archaeon]
MISNEEYSKLIQKLGREPNFAELNVIGAMWSEHISYKSSKRWFSLFKTTAPYIALGIGEGAGLIDIGGCSNRSRRNYKRYYFSRL